MKFLEDRPNDVNQSLLAITRKIIVDSAIEMRLIQDDDLAFIPEVWPLLDKLAGESRDDIYNYHNKIEKSLQFPIIQRFFCYDFAKGVESAYLWNQSSSGQISFNYSLDDALLDVLVLKSVLYSRKPSIKESISWRTCFAIFKTSCLLIRNTGLQMVDAGWPMASHVGCSGQAM